MSLPYGWPTSAETATQAFCGKLFLELWSPAESGFPVPKACYITLDQSLTALCKTQEKCDHANGEADIWEFTMIFSRGNGLQKNMPYEVVVNAQMSKSFTENEQNYLEVWCMGDPSHFQVLEIGYFTHKVGISTAETDTPIVRLAAPKGHTHDTVSSATTAHGNGFTALSTPGSSNSQSFVSTGYCMPPASEGDSSPDEDHACKRCQSHTDCGDTLTSEGYNHTNSATSGGWCETLMSQVCGGGSTSRLMHLDSQVASSSLQFQLVPTPDSVLKAQDTVSIVLFPLLAWNIDGTPNCGAKLIYGEGSASDEEPEVTCHTESVIGQGLERPSASGLPDLYVAQEPRINAIRLTMPNMNEQGYVNDVSTAHIIEVGHLRLPETGYQQTGVSVTVARDGANTQPFYWEWWRMGLGNNVATGRYEMPMTVKVAKVLHRYGDGNAKPFRGEKDNLIYMTFTMGPTLANKAHPGNFVIDGVNQQSIRYGIEIALPKGLKKNLANKIFGYSARCEFWAKIGLRFWILVGYVDFLANFGAKSDFRV